MSEYWVSKKRYFCKYCEIYIADDVPSRQHHENGLRHKGNVERFIRGIYKTGEKRKKDQEEEKREMARVEQAAHAAFAQDLSLGHAKASSTPVASSSTSTAPRKAATKPSNPLSNYSTAAQLGYTDPDVEKMQIRKSQGLVGEWQVVEPTHTQPRIGDEEKDVKPADCAHGTDTVSLTESTSKRAADSHPDDDSRAFKLRKKTAAVGLGHIYDPGVIPTKLKKKEETTVAEVPLLTAPIPSSSSTDLPKWTAISLKGKDSSVSSSSIETEGINGQSSQSAIEEAQPQASRWAKVVWIQPIKEEDTTVAPTEQPSQNAPVSGLTDKETVIKYEKNPPLTVKAEVNESSTLEQPSSLFKKRKTPANPGRGRRPL